MKKVSDLSQIRSLSVTAELRYKSDVQKFEADVRFWRVYVYRGVMVGGKF